MAKLEMGLMVGISSDASESFQKVADLGIPTCQMSGGGEALMEGNYPSAEKMPLKRIRQGCVSVPCSLHGPIRSTTTLTGPPPWGSCRRICARSV